MRAPWLLAALLLGGCSVGPVYKPPALPASAPFVAGSTLADRAPVPAHWWRLYNDPRLDALIGRALAANTDLRSAEANLAGARAALDAARAGRLPATRFNGGVAYGVSFPALLGLDLTGQKVRADSIYEMGLDASWEIDLWGRVAHGVAAAKAEAGAAAAVRDAVAVEVAAETARAFADVCADGEELDVQRRSVGIADRALALTRISAEAGTVGPLEVKRAASLDAATRAALPAIAAARQAALYRLAVLTGQTPETPLPAVEACVSAPVLNRLPVGDGRALLRRRPDVRAAERKLAAATELQGVSVADLYPRIDLGAAFDAIAGTIGGLAAGANEVWQVGPGISWTFPNQALPRARLRGAKATVAADLASFDGTVLAALRDVEQAMAAVQGAKARRDALVAARNDDLAALRIAEERFQVGTITFLERLDAERTLIADEAGVAAADAALADAEVLLFKALGGGWET